MVLHIHKFVLSLYWFYLITLLVLFNYFIGSLCLLYWFFVFTLLVLCVYSTGSLCLLFSFLIDLSVIFIQIRFLRNKIRVNLNWLFLDSWDYFPLDMILRCSGENFRFGRETSWDVSNWYFLNRFGFNSFITTFRELLWLHLKQQ